MRTSRGYSIIGGVHGLADTYNRNFSPPKFLTENSIRMVDARSAIWLLVKRLEPPKVWLPSYLCSSIADAVNQTGAKMHFYPVDYDLKTVAGIWLDEVDKGDLVILIDYFGYPYDFEIARHLNQKDSWLLEDASQALLSSVYKHVSPDFIVYSPRKFIGVPDGGILEICNRNAKSAYDWSGESLNAAPSKWWDLQLRATKERHTFDLYGGDRRWFQLFRDAKNSTPIGPYEMSKVTLKILIQGFNYNEISEQRRSNYNTLTCRLKDIALFPELPCDVVPQGFPVRVREREVLLNALFAEDIYPPIHWPIRNLVPDSFAESHRLADEIMTIPCDQRYSNSDMEIICDIIQNLT